MGNKINLEIKENIAKLRFADPDNLNPLNKESAKELLDILEDLKEKDDVRCIIITGSGRAFSAGGDIKLFKKSIENNTTAQEMDNLTKDLYKIAYILRLYPKPIIASVNGWAVGAGMNLALSCDFIIASDKAKFRQSFSKLGLIPGFAGSILLSRQLTWQKATQMAFFGETYSAEDMDKLGLINEIVPSEKLDETTAQWAKKLAKGPTLAFA
ncbi:hypothetical protein LCGC14_1917880, partial [marine sediment metagenome]